VILTNLLTKHIVRICLFVFLVSTACSLGSSNLQPTLQAQQTDLAALQAQQTDLATLQLQQTSQAQTRTAVMLTATARVSPTPRLTATPINTATPIPSPTLTSTETSTPSPTATVKSNANLREGPGTVYSVISSLVAGTLLNVNEIDPGYGWFKVEVDKTKAIGWVSIDLVDYAFSLGSIDIAIDIPPTPYIQPTPYNPPATQAPTVALAFDAHIDVTNNLEVALTIVLSGPYYTSFTVGSGQTLRVDVPSGTYNFTATAYGYYPDTGTKTWDAGDWTWTFSPV
jgi:hypothetical protein